MVGAMSGRALAALALMPSCSFDRVVEVADAVIVDSFFASVCVFLMNVLASSNLVV